MKIVTKKDEKIRFYTKTDDGLFYQDFTAEKDMTQEEHVKWVNEVFENWDHKNNKKD